MVLSGSALTGGQLLSSSGRSVHLYFPGFRALALKLLFCRADPHCHTTLVQDPADIFSQYALVHPVSNTLPIGFQLYLQPRPHAELSSRDLLARNYFVNTLAPTFG